MESIYMPIRGVIDRKCLMYAHWNNIHPQRRMKFGHLKENLCNWRKLCYGIFFPLCGCLKNTIDLNVEL
jgi:hypothetical protein